MVVRRRKKSRKYRGSRYMRRGYNDRNRGAGNRGGRGMSGWKFGKQKWHKIVKEHPEKFEDKKGFVNPKAREINAISLSYLSSKLDSWLKEGKAKVEEGKIIVNLMDLGYNKILGGGNIDRAIKVITQYATRRAIEKIEKAGGEVEIVKW